MATEGRDLTAERADLAAIKLSVKRYRGPSEHDTCVKDMKVLLAALKTARQEALKEAAKVIPTNWLDPLLSGVRTSSCPEIEQLLLSIKAQLDRLASEGG